MVALGLARVVANERAAEAGALGARMMVGRMLGVEAARLTALIPLPIPLPEVIVERWQAASGLRLLTATRLDVAMDPLLVRTPLVEGMVLEDPA